MININRLKYELKEKGYTIKDLSNLLGISTAAFYMRLNKNKFNNKEIELMATYLNITKKEDFIEIFFKDFVASQ